MSLFDWLLVGHLVGDFLLQSDNMARYKGYRLRWMSLHISLYMTAITIMLVAYTLTRSLPLGWLAVVWLFILSTHVILDLRGFTARWMRLVGITSEHDWLPIVVDQVFHLLTLAIAAQVLVLVQG